MHNSAARDDFECFVCPTCDHIFSEAHPYDGVHLTDDDIGYSPYGEGAPSQFQPARRSRAGRGNKGKGSKGADELNFEPKSEGDDWVSMSDRDPKFPLVPSAKTTVLKSILLRIFHEAPMDKVCSLFSYSNASANILGSLGCHLRSVPPSCSHNRPYLQRGGLEIPIPNRRQLIQTSYKCHSDVPRRRRRQDPYCGYQMRRSRPQLSLG